MGLGMLGWAWRPQDLESFGNLGMEMGIRVGISLESPVESSSKSPRIPLEFPQDSHGIPIPTGLPWQWRSRDGSVALPAFPDSLRDLTDPFDLCLTGEGLEQLRSRDRDRLLRLIPHIQVFARVAPKQKVRRGLGMGIPKIWGL